MNLIDYSSCTFPFRRMLTPQECRRTGAKRKGGNNLTVYLDYIKVHIHYRGQISTRTFTGKKRYQKARRYYSLMNSLKIRELRFWDTMPHVVEAYKAFTVIAFKVPGRKRKRQRWRFPFEAGDDASYLAAFERAKAKYFIVSEPRLLREGFTINPYREFDAWIPDPPVIPGQSIKAFTAIDPLEAALRATEYAP